MSEGATDGGGGGGGGPGKEKVVAVDVLLEALKLDKELLHCMGTRGLLKVLVQSVYVCNNSCQRRKVRTFIDHLHEQKFAGVQEVLYVVLWEFVSSVKEGFVSTPSSSKLSLEYLKWIIMAGRSSNKFSPTYCNLLAMLLSRIQNPRLERSATQRLDMFFRTIGKDAFAQIFKQIFTDVNLVAISIFVKFLLKRPEFGQFGENGIPSKAQILDLFVKECLMTKKVKTPWFLSKTSNCIFPLLTEKDCSSILIPAIQKAMLRSPEITAEAVAHSLKWIAVDLSPFAADLSKALGGCLYSKEDTTREQAMAASVTLASHMDVSGALTLVNRYLDIFGGSEGKLTVAAYKIGILQTIEDMGTALRKRNAQPVENAKIIFSRGVKILETEVHEGTLAHVWKMMIAWLWVTKGTQPELAAYFPKALQNMKGNARAAACEMFSVGRTALGLTSDDAFIDICTKTFEKSYLQVVHPNGLAECICIANALLSSDLNLKKESFVESCWNLVPHINEKYLSTCPSDWIFDAGVFLLSVLFEQPYGPDRKILFFNTIASLFLVKDFEARKQLRTLLMQAVGKVTNMGTLQDIISGFERMFKDNVIPDKYRTDIILSMCTALSEDIRKMHLPDVAVALLRPCHLCSQEDLWIRAVLRCQYDPAKAVASRQKELRDKFIVCFDNSDVMRAIIKTLMFVGREGTFNNVVKEFLETTSVPEIMSVERDDFFIFLTPEDQLYDTSVIEAADGSTKNLKRESRVYSYKEQLEEIQLRKELEEKRKQSGKPIQYTVKQKEAIKVQLAKESAIRDNVSKLNKLVIKGVGLLESSWNGNPDVCGVYIKDFISKLVELMKCPVSAPHAVKFYTSLGKSLFPCPVKGEELVQISLRLIKPTCDLNPEWRKVSLQAALIRTLGYMLEVFQEEDELCGAKFAFLFPTLRLALDRSPNDPKTTLFTSVLQIVLTVAKSDIGVLADSDTLIPRLEVIDFLYGVIATKDGVVQQTAVASAIQLAKTVANETYISIVKERELRLHLNALTEASKLSRETGMKCLNILGPFLQLTKFPSEFVNEYVASVYREKFDSSSEITAIAEETWKKAGFEAEQGLHRGLYDAALHPCEEVRHSASKALAAFLKDHPSLIESTLGSLLESHRDYSIPTPALLDNLGRVLQPEIDRWEARCGVGLAVREMAVVMTAANSKMCMEWLINVSLADKSPAVHNIMLEAAVEIAQVHGPVCLNQFIATIEIFLEKAGSSGVYDNVRQACVVLMGNLARHLDPKDDRVKSIFTTLIDTLSTPSEKVQEAVANCLPALVPAISAESEVVLKGLLEKVMEADNFGERRGAAFGIAGVIKGLGILSLKHHDIMNILATGMQDKKNFKHREGSLMCLELLCEFLGRLFEPYIVHVLPYLLQCLGDSNVYVREATENTAKRVMSRLSAHGVKLVLPSLIGALNEDSWRTKCGSVDLLGRMAYCAPKQLSGCLPMIVPRLIEVLGDSHVKVQEAGAKALSLIGSVIQNPEIQSVVPILLEALQDPSKRSTSCLNRLLQTEFVHFVDPPSLALIMPVVQRAFQDRSTENRKMACQVIGNMYSLTDHSDLAPYMENVMPGIKASLVDPVPEVRAVAAKALGSMAGGMGAKCYDELLPWLMKTLISESNSVDRSGAAQGLAEVIGSLGEDKLHRFMPEIIKKADSDDLAPHVRDGYMMMFIYMPGVFESEFVPYIGQIINPILKALADENEFVRETALRAGQRIVTGFAETAITLLLPELEKGIFDENWRIRFSSIQLLGDLLYKISGVSGKMSTESASEDDNFGTEQSQQTIISSLGVERRNRVLSGLYMGRSDVALMVRQAALHVWKVVVANTPKTLREILPTLFSLLLGFLASSSHDKRQVAARTLGDLVRKLGEKILAEIIPILEKGLESPRADERQGVCIGLSEIMAATSREMVMVFVDNLVPTLRKAICDPDAKVREAAAKTFGSLHSTVGSRALDEIVPYLMRKLNDPVEGEHALDGLGQILTVKSKAVMPYLVPQLTTPPVNTKALATIASVAGDSLGKHLVKIIPALLNVITDTAGTPQEKEELEHCERIVLTIMDDVGVRIFIEELMDQLKTGKESHRRATVKLLSLFCIHTKADLEPFMSQLIRGLFLLMTDSDEVILTLVADSLTAIVKNLDSSEKLAYVGDVRQAVRYAQMDLRGKPLLPGLCTPKGISPVLPIFREALLKGSADVKEQAAIGMGELISLSTEDALKASVIHITGPLIRILGDRYNAHVKVAVLETLTILLVKVGIHLKAFLPQLQTTFVKATNDKEDVVRAKAECGLAQLTPLIEASRQRQ